jgi:hypothetical protein
MQVIFNVGRTDITLRIPTRTLHFIATVLLHKGLLTFIAFADKSLCHGFFDKVLRGQTFVGLVA